MFGQDSRFTTTLPQPQILKSVIRKLGARYNPTPKPPFPKQWVRKPEIRPPKLSHHSTYKAKFNNNLPTLVYQIRHGKVKKITGGQSRVFFGLAAKKGGLVPFV